MSKPSLVPDDVEITPLVSEDYRSVAMAASDTLSNKMRMVIAYAEIVERHLSIWDTEGAVHAYDKLVEHMIDASRARDNLNPPRKRRRSL